MRKTTMAATLTVALALTAGTMFHAASAAAQTPATASASCRSPEQWAPESDFVAESKNLGHDLAIVLTCDTDGTTHWSASDTQAGIKMMTVRNEMGKLVKKQTLMTGPDYWMLHGFVVNKQGENIWQQWTTNHVNPRTMSLVDWNLNAVVVSRADGVTEANILYWPFAYRSPLSVELLQNDGSYSVEHYKNLVLTSRWHKATELADLVEVPAPKTNASGAPAEPQHLSPGVIKDEWEAMPPIDQQWFEALPYHGD